MAQAPIDPQRLTGQYNSSITRGTFHGQAVVSTLLASTTPKLVLGATAEPKHIEVDLTNQRLYAFQGTTKVYDFPVSTGKWFPTPTGTFHIWGKFRYTLMHGGNELFHTYYYLPNVPFVMFFSNDQIVASRGFSLHGTYWHNNFGHPMSHGCVNMRTTDAQILFYWTDPNPEGQTSVRAADTNQGTEIIIYGTAPSS